jgi:hypothetical protein
VSFFFLSFVSPQLNKRQQELGTRRVHATSGKLVTVQKDDLNLMTRVSKRGFDLLLLLRYPVKLHLSTLNTIVDFAR